jgi:hypothetical protein
MDELVARADYEHHLWTHGDPRGFYGQYRQHQCDSVAARGRCRDGERFCCGGYDR